MEEQYLDQFEEKLEKELIRICTTANMLNGILLSSEDIDRQWDKMAPEYIADGVKQIAQYPTVSVAWAGYLGMAIAKLWDKDFDFMIKQPYISYYGKDGFDDMDEHIVRNILNVPLESKEADNLEDIIRKCGETAVNFIRHEQIEPQSKRAFYVYARTCKVMFRIGASLELKKLGYKFEKIENLN